MGRTHPSNTANGRYPTLEPRVKHVSEAAVRKKWRKLPSSSHAAAREVIQSAKEQSKVRKGRLVVDTTIEDCLQEVAIRYYAIAVSPALLADCDQIE